MPHLVSHLAREHRHVILITTVITLTSAFWPKPVAKQLVAFKGCVNRFGKFASTIHEDLRQATRGDRHLKAIPEPAADGIWASIQFDPPSPTSTAVSHYLPRLTLLELPPDKHHVLTSVDDILRYELAGLPVEYSGKPGELRVTIPNSAPLARLRLRDVLALLRNAGLHPRPLSDGHLIGIDIPLPAPIPIARDTPALKDIERRVSRSLLDLHAKHGRLLSQLNSILHSLPMNTAISHVKADSIASSRLQFLFLDMPVSPKIVTLSCVYLLVRILMLVVFIQRALNHSNRGFREVDHPPWMPLLGRAPATVAIWGTPAIIALATASASRAVWSLTPGAGTHHLAWATAGIAVATILGGLWLTRLMHALRRHLGLEACPAAAVLDGRASAPLRVLVSLSLSPLMGCGLTALQRDVDAIQADMRSLRDEVERLRPHVEQLLVHLNSTLAQVHPPTDPNLLKRSTAALSGAARDLETLASGVPTLTQSAKQLREAKHFLEAAATIATVAVGRSGHIPTTLSFATKVGPWVAHLAASDRLIMLNGAIETIRHIVDCMDNAERNQFNTYLREHYSKLPPESETSGLSEVVSLVSCTEPWPQCRRLLTPLATMRLLTDLTLSGTAELTMTGRLDIARIEGLFRIHFDADKPRPGLVVSGFQIESDPSNGQPLVSREAIVDSLRDSSEGRTTAQSSRDDQHDDRNKIPSASSGARELDIIPLRPLSLPECGRTAAIPNASFKDLRFVPDRSGIPVLEATLTVKGMDFGTIALRPVEDLNM